MRRALKTATVEAAKESERGIVDLDTLKTTNQALISTFDEVMKIQEDGRAKRREAEGELARMELELKNKLLEIRGIISCLRINHTVSDTDFRKNIFRLGRIALELPADVCHVDP